MVVDVSGFSGMCERFAQGFVPDGGWRQRMKVSRNKGVSRANMLQSRLAVFKRVLAFWAFCPGGWLSLSCKAGSIYCRLSF